MEEIKKECKKCGIIMNCAKGSIADKIELCVLCDKNITDDVFILRGQISKLSDSHLKKMMIKTISEIERKIQYVPTPKEFMDRCEKLNNESDESDEFGNLEDDINEGKDYFEEVYGTEEQEKSKVVKKKILVIHHKSPLSDKNDPKYICNATMNVERNRISNTWDNVTCKNCLRCKSKE